MNKCAGVAEKKVIKRIGELIGGKKYIYEK